jgi:multidrug efflux pump subunit AcrB
MSTVINNPNVEGSASSGMGFVLGIIALLVLGGIFIVYLLPQLRAPQTEPAQTTIEVKLPPTTPAANTTP